ncbi:MAG: hypothetical protein KFH98_09895 [Gemmatimonadetes bacterium]|nr:hypothetical protein [Gemmatimonadota bacterium]
MDASQIYMEEFRRRGERAAAQQVGRDQLLREAAHEAYQAASDRLTREYGWEDEHTLVVMRGLNGAVQQWMQKPGADWDALGEEMRRREEELKNGFPDGDGHITGQRRAGGIAGSG